MSFFAFKKILLTTSAICGLSFTGTANAAIEVGTWADFKNAITSGTETDIILTGDIVVDSADSLTLNHDINISSKGDNKFTISAADGVTFSKTFIQNASGKKLTLSNIELNGFNNTSTRVDGGAIYNNSGTISSITDSTFTGNSTRYNGGAIYNKGGGTISSIAGSTFAGNSTGNGGGAISNSGTISSITGSTFTGNSANNGTYGSGGAIYNSNGTISNITGSTFTGNRADNGGAIYNISGTISNITGSTFTGNTAKDKGGAIWNGYRATIETLSATFENNNASSGGAIYNDDTIGILSATFENNKASGTRTYHGGGAIYNDEEGTINLVADAADSSDNLLDEVWFKGNTAVSGKGNGIYNTGDLTFTGNNNGAFAFYDDIYSDGGTMTFAGDGTGTFYMLNDIKGTGNITFNSDYAFNMINDTINVIQAGNLTINSVINMAVDVDLANATMDSFVASSAAGTGKIIINNMNLISEATADKTIIPFITAGTNNTAVSSAISKIDTGSLTHYYNVSYADGNFTFDKMQRESNEVAEDVGVPAVSAGVQQTQSALNSLLANREVYASLGLASGDASRPTTWAKAFGSKDDVELKNSYNSIDTQFYGVVGGVDSRTFVYDNGINAIYGIYAAYMGSNQKQNSVKVTQDGGYLGVSADFTKSGVFSRFTAHGGYIANEAKTAWGNDKFDIWTASVSNKTGYEINFGEYTLKPALYASYMYINTENYTSKSGAKLKNHTKNVFEVTPEVKLAKDFGEGLEGYAKVAYTWNFYQGGKVTADDVLLPKMSVKPYVEYGVGLEKDWSEEEWNAKDITSYAEINRHDGGRTGWDINAGLKFQF